MSRDLVTCHVITIASFLGRELRRACCGGVTVAAAGGVVRWWLVEKTSLRNR